MNDGPAMELDDHGGGDELPKDLVFLLTPALDIYRRIEPREFVAFVSNVDRAIDDQFLNEPVCDGIEIQVACALLPGNKKLVEFQVRPPIAGSAHVERLAAVIDQMPIPEVIEGPVAFFRRGVFGGGTRQEGGFGLPFVQFPLNPGTVLLDDLLMQAGAVPSPSKSLWSKLTGFFQGETKPVRTIMVQEIVPSLSKQLGRAVIVCNGRVGVGY